LRVSRMAEGEREGKLPTKGSGRQSSKTHGEGVRARVCV